MSECGVCISSDPDGSCEFITVETRKARKVHKCCECDKEIAIGERYEAAAGKYDGEIWTAKTCLVCAEIAEAFYCNGRMFGGGLWESMDYLWDSMNTTCFDKLTTVVAKTELQRRWNEWRFE